MINKGKIIRTVSFIVYLYCFFKFPIVVQSLPTQSLEYPSEILTEQITTVEIFGNTRTLAKVFYGMMVNYFNLIFADKNNGN